MTYSGCKILHQLVTIGIILRREAEGGGGHGSLWDGLGQTGYPCLNGEWERDFPGEILFLMFLVLSFGHCFSGCVAELLDMGPLV